MRGIKSGYQHSGLTSLILGSAIEVHKELGPGLLETTYEKCLFHELQEEGLHVESQVILPVVYKSIQIDQGFRADLIVENKVIIELKSVEALAPVHEAQLLTYLKFSTCNIGLLLNFNVEKLNKGGIRRLAL